jgi:putative transcriptional regulator
MMQPTRHPSEALILDHARGVLESGRDFVLRAHLAACPACRAQARLAEAVGGAMMDELEPAKMAHDALAKALAALDRPPPTPPPAAAPVPPNDWIRVPPDVLTAAARHRRQAAPGVWVAHVTRSGDDGPRSYLLGVGPGIAVPMHTHRGREFVCVLKGSYEDRGQIYRPGDFAENDDEVEHQPRITRDGECVCLIAADNLLVPRSMQARLLQPFVGI